MGVGHKFDDVGANILAGKLLFQRGDGRVQCLRLQELLQDDAGRIVQLDHAFGKQQYPAVLRNFELQAVAGTQFQLIESRLIHLQKDFHAVLGNFNFQTVEETPLGRVLVQNRVGVVDVNQNLAFAAKRGQRIDHAPG